MLTKIRRDKHVHEHHAYETKTATKKHCICECGDLSVINLVSFKLRKCMVE